MPLPTTSMSVCQRTELRINPARMRTGIHIYGDAKLVFDRRGEEARLYTAARTAVLAPEGDLEGRPPRAESAGFRRAGRKV